MPASSPPISTKVFKESQDIAADVESAAADFKVLQERMNLILADLKAQHASMIDLSEKRLQTAELFETFVAKTPLSHLVAGECGAKPEPKAPLVGSPKTDKKKESGKVPEEAAPEKKGTKVDVPPAADKKKKDDVTEKKETDRKDHRGKKEHTKDEKKEEKEDNKENKDKKDVQSTQQSTAEKSSTEAAAKDPKKMKEEPSKTEDAKKVAEKPIVKSQSHDHAYLDVIKEMHEVSTKYTNQYNKEVIKYAEDWLTTVSDRVKARQLQFEELKESYEHYAKKVEGLKPRLPLSPGKKLDRMERNELKLRGAREAYDNAGESMLLLLEEITEMAWKDFYPLFRKQMAFDAKYEAELAAVYSKLTDTIPKLEELGEKHLLKTVGRLDSIEKLHPEELYTGKKRVVKPVLETKKEDSQASL